MPNFETLTGRIDYNVFKGSKSLIAVNAYNLPQLNTVIKYRNILVELVFHDSSGGDNPLPSGITISLWRPKEFYMENGIRHPIDKWGASVNAIPPRRFQEPKEAEFHTNTPDADFELEQWVHKYWDAVPGLSFVGRDSTDMGWPEDLRHAHTINLIGSSPTDPQQAHIRDFSDIRLHVSATLDDRVAEKYCMLITMWRTDRTLKKVIEFSVQGSITGHDLVEAAYLPIAIVYSPPGQDMTNSLVESESHGTRFTFGVSVLSSDGSGSGLQASGFASYKGYVGINAAWEESAESQIVGSDSSSSTIRVTQTQETMITANNQRAIGRAYWGPLGDLFVIIRDFLFYVGAVFDEDTGYLLQPLPNSPRARKLILATHELLKPEPGSVADQIDWVQRKNILRLDPFVVKDDMILDAVRAGTRPLADAVDPEADPNAGNNPTRAVKVLNLDLGRGSELNFYEATEIAIDKIETHAESYETNFSQASELGIFFGLKNAPAYAGISETIKDLRKIQYQTTSEMHQTTAKTKTAKCYLVRNQNDATSEILDVYYDTVFGTFLFRKIRQEPGFISISGVVTNKDNIGIAGVHVEFRKAMTATASTGSYNFPNQLVEPKRKYTLTVKGVRGKSKQTFTVEQADIDRGFKIVNIVGAIKVLDPTSSRYIDFMEAYGLSLAEVHELSKRIRQFRSEDELLRHLNLPSRRQKDLKRYYTFVPLMAKEEIKKDDGRKQQPSRKKEVIKKVAGKKRKPAKTRPAIKKVARKKQK